MNVVIGLGANLGDRLATLRAASRALSELGTVEARSRIYESAPVGGPGQPDYLNAAMRLTVAMAPHELLDALQAIEHDHGRVRHERWAARTLDLDILWIDGEAHHSPRLEVPHPRLRERAFALAPLLDVAPDAEDPITGAPYELSDLAGVVAVAHSLEP